MAASILLPRNRSHVDAKFDLLFYSVMNYIQGDEFAGKAAFKSRGKENRLILLPVKAKGSKFRMCWWRMPSKRKSNKGENHETKRVVLVALTGYDRFLNPRRNDRLILIEFAILVADWFFVGRRRRVFVFQKMKLFVKVSVVVSLFFGRGDFWRFNHRFFNCFNYERIY